MAILKRASSSQRLIVATRLLVAAVVVAVVCGVAPAAAKILPPNGNSVNHCDSDFDPTCGPDGRENDAVGVEPAGADPAFSSDPSPRASASTVLITQG